MLLRFNQCKECEEFFTTDVAVDGVIYFSINYNSNYNSTLDLKMQYLAT
jgi:hypothetical protein